MLSFNQRMSSTIHDQIRDTLQPANCSFLIDIRLLWLFQIQLKHLQHSVGKSI